MTGGESAEHRNVILSQQVVKHSFNTYNIAIFVCKFSAAADELTKNNSLATVEHTVHLQQAHLAVDVTHILTDFFHKKNQVFTFGGIGPGADVRRKGTEIAANEHTTGLSQNVLLMCRNFITGNLAQQQVAHHRASLVSASLGQSGTMLITPARLQNP